MIKDVFLHFFRNIILQQLPLIIKLLKNDAHYVEEQQTEANVNERKGSSE